jgi:hypothetical protein
MIDDYGDIYHRIGFVKVVVDVVVDNDTFADLIHTATVATVLRCEMDEDDGLDPSTSSVVVRAVPGALDTRDE